MGAIFRSLTTRGLTFLWSGLALAGMGVLFGQRDITRLGILLVALVVIALFLARRHDLTFATTRSAQPPRMVVDEPSVVTLRVSNTERGGSPLMLAEDGLDYALGDRPRFVIPSMGPGSHHEVQYTVRSPTRGVHQLGPLQVRIKDPFGLTLRSAEIGDSTHIVVLPRIVPLGSDRPLGSGVGAEGSVPHLVALHGEDDQTVREYRDGDDLRRIHWPATARTGDLMVRQEDRPTKRQAVLLLDTRARAHGGSGRSGSLEWSVTMAASVLAHLTAAGVGVHLLTLDPGEALGIRHDESLESGLDGLARVRAEAMTGLDPLFHAADGLAARGGLVVFLGGPMTDDGARRLASLRQGGGRGVALIADPAAFAGRWRAGDAGGHGPGHDGADADSVDPLATVAALGAAGWHAMPVTPTITHDAAWAAATRSTAVAV